MTFRSTEIFFNVFCVSESESILANFIFRSFGSIFHVITKKSGTSRFTVSAGRVGSSGTGYNVYGRIWTVYIQS